MTNDASPDLAALCAAVARGLEEVDHSIDADWATYARGGAVFARVARGRLDLRLPAPIASAALRTPDTAPDPDDRGWIRFTPRGGGRDVVDRASAWFETAWRHALDH